jgi:hypothetical protein
MTRIKQKKWSLQQRTQYESQRKNNSIDDFNRIRDQRDEIP